MNMKSEVLELLDGLFPYPMTGRLMHSSNKLISHITEQVKI